MGGFSIEPGGAAASRRAWRRAAAADLGDVIHYTWDSTWKIPHLEGMIHGFFRGVLCMSTASALLRPDGFGSNGGSADVRGPCRASSGRSS